jgi:tripartite-type tricarboxylate transporter receptor subunit TctC
MSLNPRSASRTQPTSRRAFLAQGGAALATTSTLPSLGVNLSLSTIAHAQATAEPWHMLSSGPPGSIPDIVARRVAEQLTRRNAQKVIVDNRPGAAGQLAVAALKAGPTDGATMLLAQGAIATVYPYLYPKLAYDAAVDLAPVSLAGEMTLALAVGPAVPASVANIRDLVAWMHSHPELANVGSPGTGTLPHLLEAMLMREAGAPWQHIVYSGGPPAMVALLGGQIAALVLPEGLFGQPRAAGRLRTLATSGSQRTALMPDVPTLVEQGYADLVVREWFAFFMSGRVTPQQIEARSKVLRVALAQPELTAAFSDAGMVATSSTPAALAARIATEQRVWEPIIRALGVRVE